VRGSFIAALSLAPNDDRERGRAFAQLRLARPAHRMAGDFRVILARKKDIEELRSRTLDHSVRELIRGYQ